MEIMKHMTKVIIMRARALTGDQRKHLTCVWSDKFEFVNQINSKWSKVRTVRTKK